MQLQQYQSINVLYQMVMYADTRILECMCVQLWAVNIQTNCHKWYRIPSFSALLRQQMSKRTKKKTKKQPNK